MSLKTKAAAAAGTAVVLGGLAFAAAPAQATTFNCIFSNGCGALHGVNENGTPVAVDAKYQNPNEMAIGYPDNSGDSATNVALVSHLQRNFGTHTWGDTAFLTFGTNTATQSACSDPIAANCPAVPAGFVHLTGAGSSLSIQFGSAPSAVPGSITFSSDLPSGISPGAYTGTAPFDSTVGLGSAAPGTYGGQSVSMSYSFLDGTHTYSATDTLSFILKVDANHVFIPAPSTTFYTIVFAKNGFWSSQCLTSVGAGKLRFTPCTLGENAGQRFYAYLNGTSGPAVVDNTPGQRFAFKNADGGNFLEDASISNPAVAQSDVADSILPGGRQLDVNGLNPALSNELWIWGP